MERRKTFALTLLMFAGLCNLYAQDSIRYAQFKHYKETGFTLGYNYNFGGKIDGEQATAFHFAELGLWKSNITTGHHPFCLTYYVANDFGLNTNNFLIGPKLGGFISIMILGLGGEVVYYTDFHGGSLRFIPSFGMFTQYFKLTVNLQLPMGNEDYQNLNKGHFNLTVRAFRIKRTDLKATSAQ